MKTFFFYDLETSGFNPRDQRIMQFAGIRTNEKLEQVGEPVNVLVKMTDDILPDPGAVMVTGITPQQTLADGISEPELAKLLIEEVFLPDTTVVGYNNIRFDDEFIRHTLWRDFYDPYEWAWSEGRSRWDMLDVVRMTRALRPDGIKWPVSDGKPVNKLELVAKENGLIHTKAHDALSDVEALIGLAKLIREKQPKLFDYLLGMRDKKQVEKLVNLKDPQPFVYTSGRYNSAHDSTTVALPVAPGPTPNSLLVYDLRFDPKQFFGATPTALASLMFASRETRSEDSFTPLPVKQLTTNKSPAVAPLGVLDEAAQKRLSLDLQVIQKHFTELQAHPEFADAVKTAFEMREPYEKSSDVESQLYDGFGSDKDKPKIAAIRNASASELQGLNMKFEDLRLNELLTRYKGRYFPQALDEEERANWESYRAEKLKRQLPKYMETLQKLSMTPMDRFLLEELQLWAESIVPVD